MGTARPLFASPLFARKLRPLCAALALSLLHGVAAHAQLSLSTAVDLALRNDPRVRAAQADVDKAKAALAETRDVYIPAVSTSGGYGKSTGVPLGLPIIFTIDSRSLIYSASQPDYIRAAKQGLVAAELKLNDTRSITVEDVVTTYVSLDNALRRRQALGTQADVAGRLVVISTERVAAGLEAAMETTRDRRTVAQLRLQQLLVSDDIEAYADHLARLTGLPGVAPETAPASVPGFPDPLAYGESTNEGPAIAADLAQARAAQYSAHGEKRYLLRPQVGLAVGYSRITVSNTESNYGVYYPQFTPDNIKANNLSLNALSIGFQVSVPLIDYLHRAKAHETAADAAHAFAQAQADRMQFLEGRHKLHRAATELAARSEIATLDQQLASQQLAAVRAQLTAAAGATGGAQLTPEDEAKAELDLDAREYDMLTAELQLHQTEISLMRQNGMLSEWLAGSLAGPKSTSLPPTPAAVSADSH